MARVNHKRVKELRNEKRSKITDRQFFTSRILAGHFEDMAAAQTRRYHYNRRVRVNLFWQPGNKSVAYTDNRLIFINCGSEVVTKIKGRSGRYDMVEGLFAHELGHVLYTDFLAQQTYLNYLQSNNWFPTPPVLKSAGDASNEKEFWTYVKADPRNMELVKRIACLLCNILEDAFVENCILNQFPGVLGYALTKLRENQFETILTVSEMQEKEADGESHIFNTIMQNLLSYAKFGQIKYGDTPLSDERIQVVFKMIPEIDQAVTTSYAKERWRIVSFIMVRCWKYIEDYLELCKQRQEDEDASGSGSTLGDVLSAVAGGIVGTSEVGSGDGEPVAGILKLKNNASNASARAHTQALAKLSQEENSGESEEENQSGNSGEGESSDPEESQKEPEESPNDSSATSASAEGFVNDSRGTGSKQETSSQEGGRIPFHQTDSASAPVGGETIYDANYQRQHYEKAASDIDRMLEQMALKAAQKQAENERLQELNEVAQNISYGNIHSGVDIRVHRIAGVDEYLENQYHEICSPLLTISRQLQRNLIQKLKDQQRGGKQTGLVMGRRLDAHALCRNDGKVFYKNNLPNEIPRISVGLLLDESGSMSCGDRSTYARAAAIILYDFCQALDIPIMVYGHSTGWSSGVDLYSYAEFESIDSGDKYRLMDISARGSNRDGAALRYVAEQLCKRNEEVRILILVSDGQPADRGYSGTAAEEDLRGIKQEYRRKGILFVAAAIGDDKQNIERIYGDSFLDITDLGQLPVKLTDVIRRHMR